MTLRVPAVDESGDVAAAQALLALSSPSTAPTAMQRRQQELATLLDRDGEVCWAMLSRVCTRLAVQEQRVDDGGEQPPPRGGVAPGAIARRVHRMRVAPRLRPFVPKVTSAAAVMTR